MYEEDEEGLKPTAEGKPQKKKSQRKTIYDVYEPSELERGHFTDYDEQVISFVLFFFSNHTTIRFKFFDISKILLL